MKKMMILGAGIYQVPLIKKAREMGLYTIVVSIPGKYPGFALADKIYHMDTRDLQGILRAAETEKIQGICTAGTDVAVAAIGYVCGQLGLSGISPQAAETVTDKWKMKQAFAAGGAATAAFRPVFSEEEAEAAAAGLGYPVCVKAVDKSGSRGVRKAGDPEELRNAYREARDVSDRDYVLVEEYIQAHEIGVDGFIQGGKPVLLVPHDKDMYRVGGVSIPGGHRFPFVCSEELSEEIRRQITLAAAAAGLDNCPFNADVFVRDGRVWVIEIGGRSGATCIPELLSIYCGFSYYEKMLRAALGEPVQFPVRGKRACMARLLFSETGGLLERLDEACLAELNREDIQWQLDYAPGEKLPAAKNGTDRIGHLIMRTGDEREFQKYYERLRAALKIQKEL